MFTDAQLEQYEQQGSVTIDSSFTTDQLNRAETAWDRLKTNGYNKAHEDPDYIEIIQHPYLEEVAKKLLREDRVHLWWGAAPHARLPNKPPFTDSGDLWARECHVDIQATLEVFECELRAMVVAKRGPSASWRNAHPSRKTPVYHGALGTHPPTGAKAPAPSRAWTSPRTTLRNRGFLS